MKEIITYLLIFLLVIIVHELGHLLSYWLLKYKPNIKFRWYGIIVGENVYFKTTVKHAIIINYCGIATGMIIILLLKPVWIDEYLVLCSIDIANLVSLLSLKREDKDKTLLEVSKEQIKELEKGERE